MNKIALILNAISLEAKALGYNVVFVNPGEGEDVDYEQRCRDSGVDGVCLVCMPFDSPQVRKLVDSDIACVTIDHYFRGISAVLSNNEMGVQKLMDYAISKGHKRIAFIHGHNNSIVTRTRLSQFNNTMAYHNLPVPEEYVCEGLYDDIKLTRKLVTKLLRLPERPTCILLPDDMSCLGAMEAARDMGLRIPEDISFAGYDGVPLTQMLTPKLTTIRQSSEDIGRTAVRRLAEMIEDQNAVAQKPAIFPVKLIEGSTVAQI